MSSTEPRKRTRPEENPFLLPIKQCGVCSTLEEAGAAKKIGTHDGKFHCDEALACAMLKLLPEFEEACVVRTRDPSILAECDIVVDVGGVYDPEALRFDHHQKGFETFFEGACTKLSSAGLVYQHFGKRVISLLTSQAQWPEHVAEVVYQKIYTNFMEAVDAIDNGVSIAGDNPKLYRVNTDLSARVGRLNPGWNEDNSSLRANESFRDAMLLTGTEFLEHVDGLQNSWWPARSIVERCLARTAEVDQSGQVMLLDASGGVPWQSHLFDIEAEQGEGNFTPVIYVLYTDNHDKWRIQCVPAAEGSFDSRRKLPEAWRGLRDDALSAASGIEGCVFVHAAGFIGGNNTFEGALAMARRALE